MPTLAQLRTLISSKVADGDLIDPSSSEITAQINSTINFYESDAFWFNEDIATLSTVAGTATLSGLPSDFKQEIVPNGLTIIDGQIHYPLQKLTPLQYESLYIDDAQGLPRAYTYREGLFYLWFIPDQVYSVKLFYRKTYADLSADGDSNDFTNYAARLIEYKTIADILRDYRSDNERALFYDQRVEIEYNKIKKETFNRTVTGELTTENVVERETGYYSLYF